jgi:putative membrane protein
MPGGRCEGAQPARRYGLPGHLEPALQQWRSRYSSAGWHGVSRHGSMPPMPISHPVIRFLLFWGVNTLSLWVADEIFGGIRFETAQSLFISGLLLGLANTFVKPVLLVLTFPITVITFGLFVLILNAFVLFMIAWLVPGFLLAGFWSGAIIALFVSILSFLVNRALGLNTIVVTRTR